MNLIETLKNKKIKVKEIPKWGVYLRKLWEDGFVSHIILNEKKSIFLYNDDGWVLTFVIDKARERFVCLVPCLSSKNISDLVL